MTIQIHPYTYAGISESGKVEYLDDYMAVLKKKIRFVHLQRFIKDNYPQALYKTRINSVMKYRMALIYTLDKYRFMIKLPDGNKATKSYLAHHLFMQDHSTFIYSVHKFEGMIDMNKAYGHFADEIMLQKDIERTMVSYFNIQDTIKIINKN